MTSTLFLNAHLIDHPPDHLYDILILPSSASNSGGTIHSITPSSQTVSTTPNLKTDEVIDLEGHYWIGPSLADAHVHFTAWALTRSRLDLSSANSAQECIHLVKMEVERRGDETKGKVLVGREFRVGRWPDIEDMTMEKLDEVSKGLPVVLLAGDLHSSWLNTAGMRYVGRDPLKETGVLFEKDAFNALNHVNKIPDEELDPIIEDAAKAAASRGVTEVVELEMNHNLSIWKRRIHKGINQLRIHAGMYDEHIHDAIDHGLKSGNLIPDTDDLLRVGPYKIITDGSLGARTAYCCANYPGTTDNGLWIYPTPTLKSMLELGVRYSLQLAVHAIGDLANSLTLQSFASLSPPALPGSSIEHAQLISEQDFDLFGKTGLIASIQPEHLNDDKELADRFWPDRTSRAFAYKSLVDAGVKIRLGSDAPVARLEPWGAIAAAVSRERGGEEGIQGASWHREQCLDVRTAWEASTWNGEAGVREGMRADLIIIGKDPLECGAKELRGMVVNGTMLGGRWTHREGV